jgi:hypothetical protein
MIAGLPYNALRDAVLTHPTLVEGSHIAVLIPDVSPPTLSRQQEPRSPPHEVGRLGLHELHIESDGDLVSNEDSAGLEGSVPGQAEVLSVNLCDRRARNSGVAPRIFS